MQDPVKALVPGSSVAVTGWQVKFRNEEGSPVIVIVRCAEKQRY